jgi:hypothetical protein
MGDDRAIDALPWVDVKVAGGAVQAAVSGFE